MFITSISASKSDTIDQCLWKYYLRYVEKISGIDSNNEEALNFGSYVHKILELGYQANDRKELIKISEELKSNYHVPQKFKDPTLKCIENFMVFNRALGETVSTEMAFDIPLDVKYDINFRGVIDRIIRGKDKSYLVIDYKTSKREKKKKDLLTDKQLMGYAYAIHTLYEVPYHMIQCAHYYPLTNNLVPVKFTKFQVESWKKKEIDKVWRVRKKKKTEFPAMRNQFCNWCEYKSACPLFNSQEQVCSRIVEQKEKDKLAREAKKAEDALAEKDDKDE